MTTILITGANRGIGLGLVKEILKDDSIGKLIATARDPNKATELQAIKDPRLHLVQLDAEKDESIKNAVQQVERLVGDRGLDILVNNAGVLYPVDVNGPLNRSDAKANFDVNCVGTLLVTIAFGPLLKKAANKQGHSQIAHLSSFLASLQDAIGSYAPRNFLAYTMSKTAINALTRNLSIDWKNDNVRVTSVDPGWVKTDMGKDDALITVEESTSKLAKVILNLKESDNGGYISYDGKHLRW